MLLLALALSALQGPDLQSLDSMCQARDVEGLSRSVTNVASSNPLKVIKTNGAYECGKYGWHAFGLTSPDQEAKYVVFSTPLTSEDCGEFLLLRDGPGLTYIPEDDSLGVKIGRHDLSVSFDTDKKSAAIVDRLTVGSQGTGDFCLRMSPEFKVSEILDSANHKIPFSQAGGIVILPKPVSGKETLTISYAGVIDRAGYSGSIDKSEATLTNTYWYPMIARQPAPYQVEVHYPENWTAVGQGIKTDIRKGFSKFKMDLPCVFYSLAAGPYRIGAYIAPGRTFYAWSPRLSQSVLETQAQTYADILAFYSSRFTEYPFKSYGGLDSPKYGGGALEAYSYATYGGGFPEVDPHEPSHTWWGGIVDNTYLHSFWNESFAVYSENYFRREWSNSPATRSAFIPKGEVSPSYDQYACATAGAFVGEAASDLGYGKGSHVLYMLEKLIGAPALLKSMRRFIADQPVGKSAEWEDFEKAAEAVNPQADLKSFFEDWLDQPGHIEFSADVSYAPGMVSVAYKPKGTPKRIPLEVLIVYPDGKSETKILDAKGSGVYNIPVSSKPQTVSLDPYRFLIRPIGDNESPDMIRSTFSNLTERPVGELKELNDLAGQLVVQTPEQDPNLAPLFSKAGFTVAGTTVTYHGHRIDLKHGAAQAIVQLENGKWCGIKIGATKISPDPGTAKVAIFDDLGKMIDGEVLPKTKGNLTYPF